MDLRPYYKNVREIEATIPGEFTVTVSLKTPDGGRAGVKSEVAKYIAAKLVVENKARLASEDEIREFYGLGPEAAVETEGAAPRSEEIRRSKSRGGKD